MQKWGPNLSDITVRGGDTVVIHPDTGEIVGIIPRDEHGKAKRAPGARLTTPYLFVFLPALEDAARDRRLIGTDYRVLLYTCTRAPLAEPDWDVDLTGTADALDIDRTRVSRSLKRLIEYGYLLRPRRGRIALHPDFAWRGNTKDRNMTVFRRQLGITAHIAKAKKDMDG